MCCFVCGEASYPTGFLLSSCFIFFGILSDLLLTAQHLYANKIVILRNKYKVTKITLNNTNTSEYQNIGKKQKNHFISAFISLPFIPPLISHQLSSILPFHIHMTVLAGFELSCLPSLFSLYVLSHTHSASITISLFCWRIQTVWIKTQLTVCIQFHCSSSVLLPLFLPHLHAPPPLHPSLSLLLQLSGGFIIKDSWRSLGSSSKSFCQTDRVSQISLPLTGGDIKTRIQRSTGAQSNTLSHCGSLHYFTICPARLIKSI